MHHSKKIFVLLGLLLTLTARADRAGGGSSTGGGDEFVAQFVERAHTVIERIEYKRQSFVDVQKLKTAIQYAKIEVVDVLHDPRTNIFIPNQRTLYAYTFQELNLIQLRYESWEKLTEKNDFMDQHVAHELLRLAGYNDDAYAISMGQLRLQLTPMQDSVVALAAKGALLSSDRACKATVQLDRSMKSMSISVQSAPGGSCSKLAVGTYTLTYMSGSRGPLFYGEHGSDAGVDIKVWAKPAFNRNFEPYLSLEAEGYWLNIPNALLIFQ